MILSPQDATRGKGINSRRPWLIASPNGREYDTVSALTFGSFALLDFYFFPETFAARYSASVLHRSLTAREEKTVISVCSGIYDAVIVSRVHARDRISRCLVLV